jgi:hypothetical protein
MTSGAQTREGRLGLPWHSSRIPGILGAEVADARDKSWRGSFTKRLYFPAKPSHMGINVDGLAYPLHRPMAHSCQMRGRGLLSSAILSCCCSGRWHLLGDVKPPRHRYLIESCLLRYLHY